METAPDSTPPIDLYQLLALVLSNLHVILEVMGGIVAVCTTLVATARGLVPLLRRLALMTATDADDRAVDALACFFDRGADGLAKGARLIERWSWMAAPRNAGDEPPRPPRSGVAGTLGVLTVCILLAGALVTTSGCATGRGSDTTPLHRASAAASALVDAGTWAHSELDRHIEVDLTEVRDTCMAANEPARDCDLEVRERGAEYNVVVAGHTHYATLVNQLVDELEDQARRREAGENPDLTRASWLAGRVLDAYSDIAETLAILGIQVPPIPSTAVAALEALR